MKKEIQYIALDKLHPHPDNPRKDLGDLTELTASIKAAGIFQNLTVVPYYSKIHGRIMDGLYTIVIGHRRRAAAEMAGLKELPCIVTEMSYKEQLSTMLLENMQRSDLTVYEQAQGFQLMLDLGDSIADISQSTGFSESTVRRRVKLLELDKQKFEKATARGATLFEFSELNKLESIEQKNKLLDSIGTPNFANQLKIAIEKEKTEERLAEIRAALDVFAFKIERNGEFGGQALEMRYVESWYGSSGKGVEVPEDAESVRYFYTESRAYGLITLYREHIKSEKDDEADRERSLRREIYETHDAVLSEANARHYALRCDFIKDYSGKNGTEAVMSFAAVKLAANDVGNYYRAADKAAELMGIDPESEYVDEQRRRFAAAHPGKALLCAVAAHCDGKSNGYWHSQWRAEKQEYEFEHRENKDLDEWYELLSELGYEMSDEERELQNGTSVMLDRQWIFDAMEDDEP